MPKTQVRSTNLEDEGVKRPDLCVSTSGSAVIAKVVAGSGIGFSSTGADAGTGDVTISIPAGAVTLSMLADMATESVYYRKTGGTGPPEVQPLATLKTGLGLAGTNTGDQTITLSGDVTGAGTAGITATISAGVVTLAKMANLAANSVIGRQGLTSGVPQVISGITDQVLRVSGSDVLNFGTIATGGITNAAVTYAKIQNVSATARLLGRSTAGAGVIEELTVGTGLSLSAGTLSATGAGFVPTSRLISTTAPLSGGGDLSADRTIVIANAAADGTTKGAAAFAAIDFNATAGLITLDYITGPHRGGYTTTAGGSTKTLVVGDTYTQIITGASSTIVNLPVVSTLWLGYNYRIVNASKEIVKVLASDGSSSVVTLQSKTSAIVTCILTTGTDANSWYATGTIIGGVVTQRFASQLADTSDDTLAAAATLDVTGLGPQIDVTGNTGITAITIAEDKEVILRFTGTPNITPGASLFTLGGVVIPVTAGGFALVRGGAGATATVLSYQDEFDYSRQTFDNIYMRTYANMGYSQDPDGIFTIGYDPTDSLGGCLVIGRHAWPQIANNGGDLRSTYLRPGNPGGQFTFPDYTGTAATLAGPETLTNKTLTTPVINGLPTGTGIASIATASTLVSRDVNVNSAFNNVIRGYATTATAAGTTTLTVGSAYAQYFTGTTTQTVKLPVTSTLVLGFEFLIVNNSTGTVTVQSSGSNTIVTLLAGTSTKVTCILTSGTTAASWSFDSAIPRSYLDTDGTMAANSDVRVATQKATKTADAAVAASASFNANLYTDTAIASIDRVTGIVYSTTDSATSSTNGTEDTLSADDLSLGLLIINGQAWVQEETILTVGSATASRRIKKYLSDDDIFSHGVLLWDSGAVTLALGSQFNIKTTLLKEADNIVRCTVVVTTTSASSVPYVTYTRVTAVSIETIGYLITTAIASGTGAAAGDIVQKMSKIVRMPR